jgi:dipeptide/tripeptide permease
VLETKTFLRILLLFVPLPIFWALFDQQGSRWTIQATKMNHKFGKFNMEPDQMQILNPLLILILVPIGDVFNPLLRCYEMYRPLRTMVLGGIFTSFAFFLSYAVQIQIDSSPEKINILWQIPQYFFITLAEVNVLFFYSFILKLQ